MTSDDALAYSAATDSLEFSLVSSAAVVSVLPTTGGTLTLLAVQRSLTFGAGVAGEIATGFFDNSILFLGGAAADNVTGTDGRDQLVGGDGGDTLDGAAGDDVVSGGAGDDVIIGGPGVDMLDGGAGIDTLSFAGATASVAVSLQLGEGGDGPDNFRNFENLQGGDGADRLAGDGGGNLIRGGAGGDLLQGLFGDDTLDGGFGRDTLEGGGGADLFTFGLRDTSLTAPDIITDWGVEDRLRFGGAAGGYVETTGAGDGYDAAAPFIAGGARFVAVQVASGVVVYADTSANGGTAEDAVLLSGRTLADISAANIVGGADPTTPITPRTPPLAPPIPVLLPPPPAAPSQISATVTVIGNMDGYHVGPLGGTVTQLDEPTRFLTSGDGYRLDVLGGPFNYNLKPVPLLAGMANQVVFGGPAFQLTITTASSTLDVRPFVDQISRDATQEMFGALLGQNDVLSGTSIGDEFIRAYGGNDVLYGLGGNDTLYGGAGDDRIYAGSAPGQAPAPLGATYLRGDEGDDYIVGAAGFDDANGNMGNDTITTGGGDDYCVGGKDNDLLYGDGGNDLVYGNLGADTCNGGDGNDIVRGGQDNDIVFGGAGDDFVSGDKGDDTMVGDAGADIFHSFGDAGLDQVADFSRAEGDRVMLDPGTQYTVAQVGIDTVISMVGGGRMVLIGVQMSSLTPGWIFGA